MKEPGKTVLYWAPRILAFLFAAFISIFALDVFGAGYKFGELLVALFMHMVPTFLVLIAIIAGWKREWISAILLSAWPSSTSSCSALILIGSRSY